MSTPPKDAPGEATGREGGREKARGKDEKPGASHRFDRVKPTEEDRQRARSAASQIRALHAGLVPTWEIAKKVRVPVEAVEAVLADPDSSRDVPADRPFVPETPEWHTRQGAPVAPVMAASAIDDLTRIMGLFGIPRNIASGVAERFSFVMADDVEALEKFLLDAGVAAPAARSVVGLYQQRASAMGSAIPGRNDEDDSSPRARLREMRRERMDALAMREYEAEVKIREREAAGIAAPVGPAPPDPRVAALEEQVRALTAQLQKFEVADAVRAANGPLYERIRALEEQKAQRTIDQVEVDGYARSQGIKFDSQAKLADTMTARIERLPTARELIATPRGQKVAVLADRRLDDLTGANDRTAQFERAGTGIGPSDSEMLAAAAVLDQTTGSADGSRPTLPQDRPRARVPRRPVDQPPPDDSGVVIGQSRTVGFGGDGSQP